VEVDDDDAAARRLYDLALEYQERSQRTEARLLDDFEVAAATASNVIGDLVIVDDDDERLVLVRTGEFRAEVIPEEADGTWRTLTGPDELVEFYDPTDVFGDLADALAEAYPAVAPAEATATEEDVDETEAVAEAEGAEGAEEAEGADTGDSRTDEDEEEDDTDNGSEGRPTA
jgi:hypothetical protein